MEKYVLFNKPICLVADEGSEVNVYGFHLDCRNPSPWWIKDYIKYLLVVSKWFKHAEALPFENKEGEHCTVDSDEYNKYGDRIQDKEMQFSLYEGDINQDDLIDDYCIGKKSWMEILQNSVIVWHNCF